MAAGVNFASPSSFRDAASMQNSVTGQGQDTTLEEDGITLFIALGNLLEGIIEGPATYASFKAELCSATEIGWAAGSVVPPA